MSELERMKTELKRLNQQRRILWSEGIKAWESTDNKEIRDAIDSVVSEHHYNWQQLRDKIQELERKGGNSIKW